MKHLFVLPYQQILIALGLLRETLRTVGWKPMAPGIALWLCRGAGSLWVIVRVVR